MSGSAIQDDCQVGVKSIGCHTRAPQSNLLLGGKGCQKFNIGWGILQQGCQGYHTNPVIQGFSYQAAANLLKAGGKVNMVAWFYFIAAIGSDI